MDNQQAKALLKKYHQGLCTNDEKALVESWYLSTVHNTDKVSHDEIEGAMYKVRQKLPARNLHQHIRWPYTAAAAVLLVGLGISSYFFTHQDPNVHVAVSQPLKNDIAPGKNTATLTLANGKRIILSDVLKGQIAEEAGVSIAKTAKGQIVYTIADNHTNEANQYNTLSTAKGETYKVNLPDGTQVWLNAASSLTYPARFAGTDRRVTLKGEAYFEVAKDKAHPFRVATDKQEVTVLGTHFDINSYTNEPATRTTLLEGSVKIIYNNNNEKIIAPGQQAVYINGQFNVDAIDTELATAWKDNKFIFDGDHIDYIMRMVERWYNVDVVYESVVSNEKFYGAVSRYENVSEVLKSLQSTGKIHFKIEGRKIIVTN